MTSRKVQRIPSGKIMVEDEMKTDDAMEMAGSDLVQITRRVLKHDRVPFGDDPVFETYLMPHQEIIGSASYFTAGAPERKTNDHRLSIWIATRMRDVQA